MAKHDCSHEMKVMKEMKVRGSDICTLLLPVQVEASCVAPPPPAPFFTRLRSGGMSKSD